MKRPLTLVRSAVACPNCATLVPIDPRHAKAACPRCGNVWNHVLAPRRVAS